MNLKKMNLKKFLGGAATAATVLAPQLAPVIGIVNAFLPDDKKLPANANGQQVVAAYDDLAPEAQREIDDRARVELAHVQAEVSQLAAMVSVESANSNTRPHIAYLMAVTVVVAVAVMMVMWARAVWAGDSEALAQLAGSWELMLAILATPSMLLRAYFGMRTREKQARYAAALGQEVQAGGLRGLVGMIRGT